MAAHLELAVAPTRDDLGLAVTVEVEANDGGGLVLRLDAPLVLPRLVVHADGAVGQRIGKVARRMAASPTTTSVSVVSEMTCVRVRVRVGFGLGFGSTTLDSRVRNHLGV